MTVATEEGSRSSMAAWRSTILAGLASYVDAGSIVAGAAGLAVGADVPASWTLIAEIAPKGARGRHSGAAQLLWGVGPLVVLLLALALSGAGLLGIRLIFG